jgi:hypothetical protein
MLMEMLPTTTAAMSPMPSHAAESASPRSSSMLVHVNGRFALALVLDGVVLCVVPVGPPDCVADAN